MANDPKIDRRTDVTPTEGEHKYGDVEFADRTNKKYPIDSAEHVRAAADPDIPHPGQVGDPVPGAAQPRPPGGRGVHAVAGVAVAGPRHRQVDGEEERARL